uniref:Uncharacterized protein n=1 Tax=Brassica campestris TaxID=3711 RepID=M4DV79_BRACM
MEGRQYYPPRETVDGNRTTMGGPHSPWHSPSRDSDLEAGDMKPDTAVKAVALPEKFLVIMAGDVNPTYLATPAEKSCTCDDDEDEEGGDDVKGNDQVVRRSTQSNGAAR